MDESSPMLRKFLRLRACVHAMKRGAHLMLRESDGMHLRWFALDPTLALLTWVDPHDRRAAEALSLSNISNIMHGDGKYEIPSPAESPSFILVTDTNKEIDIVAPNWREFETWYQGLVFLTGIGAASSHRLLDMLRSKQRADETSLSNRPFRPQTDLHNRETSVWLAKSSSMSSNADSSPSDYFPSPRRTQRQTSKYQSSQEKSDRLLKQIQALEGIVSEQQKIIENLNAQNEILQDIRFQKDQTIQRLLRDLQESSPHRPHRQVHGLLRFFLSSFIHALNPHKMNLIFELAGSSAKMDRKYCMLVAHVHNQENVKVKQKEDVYYKFYFCVKDCKIESHYGLGSDLQL
eukprot:TRINITY_DN2606_c0_g2_i2.p1 TRINITY_DN2606_c0_g2~~TRINITY_DN2606_c0_g2_i2.p1  ORF type:complete len:348 (-),score=65.96 TRINITY_DN2606_c0_g2_i2:1869-2912(-)